MIAQDIITRVRQELVETVGSFWTDSELLTLINKGEKAFLNDIRYLEDRANLAIVSGTDRYPLPSNFLSERAVFFNDTTGGGINWKRLTSTSLEKMAQEHPSFLDFSTDKQGIPTRCFIWQRELYFDAVPNISTTVVMFYKSKPIALTAATQSLNVDDSLGDAIEAYVLWKAWKKEKEPDLAAEARAEYEEWIGKGRRWVKKQAEDRRNRIDIESAIPFNGGFSSFSPFL